MGIIKRLSSLLIISLFAACTNTVSLVAVNERMLLIAPNVFVDKAMSIAQQRHFLASLSVARQKIQRFFGSLEANPMIYACTTVSCESLFGGVKAKAKSYGDSKVLLTATGLDSMTITHELAHIELHKRIGNKQAWHKIPMWFDEGLAVLICEDPRYDERQWQRIMGNETRTLVLDKLVTNEQWVDAVRQGQWPYGIARKVVQNWYSERGHQALEALILRMRQGEAFHLHDKAAHSMRKYL